MTIRTEMRGFAEGVVRFSNLKHLILNIDVQGPSESGSGILRLAYLLKLVLVLEELELNMYYSRSMPIYTNTSQLDKMSSPCPHRHLKIVRMTGFYGIRGQLELAHHILHSVNSLEHLIIDPKVRVEWGPRPDWWRHENRFLVMGGGMARLFVCKGERSRLVTIL
ncbi:hypothetical protein ACP4OV_008996 [Aristida adscensionis]